MSSSKVSYIKSSYNEVPCMKENLSFYQNMKPYSSILKLLASGYKIYEIGKELKMGRSTVEHYLKYMRVKNKARTNPHLVAMAFRLGVFK